MQPVQINDDDLLLIRSYILGDKTKEDLEEVIDKLEYVYNAFNLRNAFMDSMDELNKAYVEKHKEEK